MDKKYGAYICTGCGIGDAIDIDELSGVVSSEMNMECKTHGAFCSAEGRALIEADINDSGVNTVVVGACSPRVMQDEFDFGVMSSSLVGSSTESALPKKRSERIRFALSVLESQRFFAAPGEREWKDGEEPYPFVVDSFGLDLLALHSG